MPRTSRLSSRTRKIQKKQRMQRKRAAKEAIATFEKAQKEISRRTAFIESFRARDPKTISYDDVCRLARFLGEEHRLKPTNDHWSIIDFTRELEFYLKRMCGESIEARSTRDRYLHKLTAGLAYGANELVLSFRKQKRHFPKKTLSRPQFTAKTTNNFFLLFAQTPAERASKEAMLRTHGLSYNTLKQKFPNLVRRCERQVSLHWSNLFTKENMDDFYKVYAFLRRYYHIPNKALFE